MIGWDVFDLCGDEAAAIYYMADGRKAGVQDRIQVEEILVRSWAGLVKCHAGTQGKGKWAEANRKGRADAG